ncbi:MAG: glycine zipper 2TM domain-containing protein [Gammaproteobacteria bacterium]
MNNESVNSSHWSRSQLTSLWLFFVVAIFGVSLVGCAPPGYMVKQRPAPNPPLPSTVVYFYPTKGQSEAQQERDRYECYLWAVKQSGFDPGQAQLAPHQRVEVTPVAPPGSDAAAGAVGGAIVGSMMSSRHDRGFGMVFGALTGAMLGAASDAARQQQAEQIQQHYDAKDAQRYARLEKQSRDYQRAMTACLEGRGYTVR